MDWQPEVGEPLKVYLDQNIWIGLAAAEARRPAGERFAGLADQCRGAVASGLIEVVLSFSHYEENWRRPQLQDRRSVGVLMFELAGVRRIATPQNVVRGEIAVALHRVLGLPGEEPTYQVFGEGAAFVLGAEDVIGDMVRQLDIPTDNPESARQIRAEAAKYLEAMSLVGPDGDYRDLGIEQLDRRRNSQYVERQATLSDRLHKWGARGDRTERFALVAELNDLLPLINEVGVRYGVTASDLVDLGADALRRFVAEMPMASIVQYLHRSAFGQSQRWQLNDHNDIVYLSDAAAYCDVVVGERHWTSKLREPKCPTRAAHVLSSPEDLRQLLARLGA